MNLLDALKTEAENGDFEGKIKLLGTLKPNGIPKIKGFMKNSKDDSQNRQKRKALVWVRKFSRFEVNEILGYKFAKHGEQVNNIKRKIDNETKVKKHHSMKDKKHGEKVKRHEHKRSKKFKKRLRQLKQKDLWQSMAPEEGSFWQPSSKLGKILCYRCTPYIQIDKIFRELTCTICKHQTYGEKRMNKHIEANHKKVPHTCKKSEELRQGSPEIVEEFSVSPKKNQNLIKNSEESSKILQRSSYDVSTNSVDHGVQEFSQRFEINQEKYQNIIENSEESPEILQGSSHDLSTNSVDSVVQEFSTNSEKNQEKYFIENSEESPDILQESSHDSSTNSVDPDADTESEGIQEAIDPWGNVDTDFMSPTIVHEFSKSSEKNQNKYQNLIENSEESPEILQESSHDLSTNSGDPDADTESEGIQEAIDPWGDIDTDFTSLPEKEIQAIKSFSKEVLKETAEEDQEKEEEEITDKDLDIENIDNLLAKTNRFLVVSKRIAEKAQEEQKKEEGEITDDDSDNENIDNLLAKTRSRFIVDSERNENSVGKQNPVKKRSPPNVNNTKTATWKMVDGKVKILSDTR